jgi:hypothetical protein
MRFILCLCIFCTLTCGCNSKKIKQQKEQILQLREMSDLTTIEYIVTKVIRASDNAWFKIGSRKILMSCQASLRAGIDLSKITEKDVSIHGKTIERELPHATLLSLNIKPEDLKTEYESVAPLRSSFSSSERDALAAQGEKSIRNSVDSLGILQTAEVNANFILTGLLQKFGYEKIIIHYGTNKSLLQ